MTGGASGSRSLEWAQDAEWHPHLVPTRCDETRSLAPARPRSTRRLPPHTLRNKPRKSLTGPSRRHPLTTIPPPRLLSATSQPASQPSFSQPGIRSGRHFAASPLLRELPLPRPGRLKPSIAAPLPAGCSASRLPCSHSTTRPRGQRSGPLLTKRL